MVVTTESNCEVRTVSVISQFPEQHRQQHV